MGYLIKLQVISRKNNTEQYYLMLPAPLGKAMELVQRGTDRRGDL